MDNDQLVGELTRVLDTRLDDIKQIFKAELSQTEQNIRAEIQEVKDELLTEIKDLRTEMHEGFEGIADIISTHNDQLDDHETRLTKLMPKAA
ncbi:MAG: hypothetical protein JWO47_652 [Candidatus Saccharibacteria bacterium]|nr:hypothetical protein [Candidatus Saccharibacteria bacterium]